MQIFQPNDSPRYHKALTAHLCLYIIYNILLVALRAIYVRRNKQKRAAVLATRTSSNLLEADAKISHSYAFDDLTDKENPDFRVSPPIFCFLTYNF
jgi:hypothetical protein